MLSLKYWLKNKKKKKEIYFKIIIKILMKVISLFVTCNSDNLMQFQNFFVNFDDLNINCFVLSNKMRRLLRLKDPEWKMDFDFWMWM